MSRRCRVAAITLALAACTHTAPVASPAPAGPLDFLYAAPDAGDRFLHVSSYDTSGGNADARVVLAGDSVVLLDLDGPAVVRRLWITVASSDPHYLRRITLKMYWDGETNPSVAAPLGDFFGDGFDKPNYRSIPMGVSSGGFYCYLPMPFRRHGRIVAENGTGRVIDAFYFNIDLVRVAALAPDVLTFHAWWHRDAHPSPRAPHLILAARGRGRFIGTSLNAESYDNGFAFLEGDEIWHVDGEFRGQGTGTEDYFNSGWYFDRGTYSGPFHGLVVKDDSLGRIAAYRWHIPDAVPFRDSIRVEIEHGTQNEEIADYATMAYWYQTEPHVPLPPLPPPAERRVMGVKIPPEAVRADSLRALARAGGWVIPVPRPDRYEVVVFPYDTSDPGAVAPPVSQGVVAARGTSVVVTARALPAAIAVRPVRAWARDWNLTGPFPNPRQGTTEHSVALDSAYGPERDPRLGATYAVVGGTAGWKRATAGDDGEVRLNPQFTPHDWVAVYGQAFLYSPDARDVTLLLGADDAHQLWVNGAKVSERQGRHISQADEVVVPVRVHAGWNTVLAKVANLDGGWAFQLRAADPDGVLRWSANEP